MRRWINGLALTLGLLALGVVVFVGTDTIVTNLRLKECRVVLYEDRSWMPTNWHEGDGFPPRDCRLVVVRVASPE
jgi:hypothetical protein